MVASVFMQELCIDMPIRYVLPFIIQCMPTITRSCILYCIVGMDKLEYRDDYMCIERDYHNI